MKNILALAVLLSSALSAAGSTVSSGSTTCPVCLAEVSYRDQMSATVFDTRLDLRPVGMIISPSPLPVCGECGFVVFAGSAAPRELAAWRAVAASPEYLALAGRGTYYRAAFLYQKLGRDRSDIAEAYLKASWEEEREPEKEKEDLGLALSNFDAYLPEAVEGSDAWVMLQYLRAELLRRLSRFPEAERVLASLRGREAAKMAGLADFIRYERKLCGRKDASPRAIGEMGKEGILTKIGDVFRGLF